MKAVLCIDDTDMKGGPGSGQLAERMTREIENRGFGQCGGICRHQLFVHEDVPYTSHNSSMSFPIEFETGNLSDILSFGQDFLTRESAEGADPGFCVVVDDERLDPDPLIEFGKRAKREVLQKNSAYELAQTLGVHLSEHGGTGDGIIGALAGAGLRLYGSDGRMRGWFTDCLTGELATVGNLVQRVGAEYAVDDDYLQVDNSEIVMVADKRVKTILHEGREVMPLVKAAAGGVQAMWATLTKEEVKRF